MLCGAEESIVQWRNNTKGLEDCGGASTGVWGSVGSWGCDSHNVGSVMNEMGRKTWQGHGRQGP